MQFDRDIHDLALDPCANKHYIINYIGRYFYIYIYMYKLSRWTMPIYLCSQPPRCSIEATFEYEKLYN